MCFFGVCMMCRSGERHPAQVRDDAEAANRPTTLAAAATDKPSRGANLSTYAPDSIEAPSPSIGSNPSIAAAGWCHDSTNETKPEQTIDLQPHQERRDPIRKQAKILLIASALVTSLAAAPALFVRDGHDHRMMERGDGMMGNGGMMGMRGSMM